jgi:hypothetical protein
VVVRAVAIVLQLIAAACLLSCGGDERLTKDEYRRAVQPIADDYERDRLAVLPDVTGPDWNLARAGLATMQRRADSSLARLQGLEPPEQAEDAHRKLLASLGKVKSGARGALDPAATDSAFKASAKTYLIGVEGVESSGRALEETTGLDFDRLVTSSGP